MSCRGLEYWLFVGDPAPLAHDNTLIQTTPSFSEETAHSTVYHHLSWQSSCVNTAHCSLQARCTRVYSPSNGKLPSS